MQSVKQSNKPQHRALLTLTCCVLIVAAVIGLRMLLLSAEQEPDPEATTVLQRDFAASEEEQQGSMSAIATAELPFKLTESGRVEEYRRYKTLESWKLTSELSCSEYAQGVLRSLQSQNLELIEAGYMDLSGECWGCVFIGANNESLSVMLLPERPFSPRSDNNRLVVNILHYLQPEGMEN